MDKIVFYLVQKRRKNRIENNTKPRGNQTRYIKYGKKIIPNAEPIVILKPI